MTLGETKCFNRGGKEKLVLKSIQERMRSDWLRRQRECLGGSKGVLRTAPRRASIGCRERESLS